MGLRLSAVSGCCEVVMRMSLRLDAATARFDWRCDWRYDWRCDWRCAWRFDWRCD